MLGLSIVPAQLSKGCEQGTALRSQEGFSLRFDRAEMAGRG
jgi:hypothetical protein